MKNHNMVFLPVNLNITNQKILIVGGGNVACQKIKLLLPFTQNITVIAKDICREIKDLPLNEVNQKAYESSDVAGFFLVYAATNFIELNKQVYRDAQQQGILVNVVDNVPFCDFVSPAIYKSGKMTVAVGSNAEDVKASINLRDKIRNFLEDNPMKCQQENS